MATGDFYYPNNSNSHTMPFPSPGHPGGHPENAFNPPGHAGVSNSYQSYYGPGSNVWNSERPFALEQAEAQMLEMAAAREDEMKDQEKRLFLEEYRYVGQQTVCSAPTFMTWCFSLVDLLLTNLALQQYEPPHIDVGDLEPTPDEIGMEVEPLSTGIGSRVESVYNGNGMAGKVSETGRGGNTASKGTGFKLRADAPEFVPMDKKSKGKKRQDSVTIVTSWY